MAQLNHKGPEEAGAMTGRKLGKCTPSSSHKEEFFGIGMGKRRKMGGGLGYGKRLKYNQ